MMAGKLGPKTATSGSAYCSRYGDFVNAMAYGERPGFDEAMGTIDAVVDDFLADLKPDRRLERHGMGLFFLNLCGNK
jgi:hypothetical protein